MLALLAYGWRTWKHAPAVAILAIAALAIGVSSTTAIYTFIEAVLLRPLPYANPDRYLQVDSTYRSIPGLVGSWSYPDCVDYSRRNHTMAVLGCMSFLSQNLTIANRSIHASGIAVTPALVRSLGVPLDQGSWFDETPQDGHAVVVSSRLWQRAGAGSPVHSIGTRLMINAVPFTLKGIAPDWFHFPIDSAAEVWYPLNPGSNLTERGNNYLLVFAKMRPSVTEAKAANDLRQIGAHLERQYPDTETNRVPSVTSLLGAATKVLRPTFLLLFAAAAVLLLIACGNVASLLLARSVARARETAVRVAIGAAGWQLAAQYVSEGLLVSLAGAGLGLLGSAVLVRLLLQLVGSRMPRAGDVHIDAQSLGGHVARLGAPAVERGVGGDAEG